MRSNNYHKNNTKHNHNYGKNNNRNYGKNNKSKKLIFISSSLIHLTQMLIPLILVGMFNNYLNSLYLLPLTYGLMLIVSYISYLRFGENHTNNTLHYSFISSLLLYLIIPYKVSIFATIIYMTINYILIIKVALAIFIHLRNKIKPNNYRNIITTTYSIYVFNIVAIAMHKIGFSIVEVTNHSYIYKVLTYLVILIASIIAINLYTMIYKNNYNNKYKSKSTKEPRKQNNYKKSYENKNKETYNKETYKKETYKKESNQQERKPKNPKTKDVASIDAKPEQRRTEKNEKYNANDAKSSKPTKRYRKYSTGDQK